MSELSKDWVVTQLNQLVKIQNGYAFPSKSFLKEGIPLIRQSNLDGDKVSLEKSVYLDPTWLEKKSEFIVNKGDILLGMSGSIGKWCKYNLDQIALQNQRVGKIIPLSDDYVNINYVLYGLVFSERQLISKGKGLGLLNVSATDIESLEIPLAPLNEQKRIVEKLDKLLARVEEAKERLEKIPVIIKRFRQSVLNAAVTGELTKDWRGGNNIIEEWEEVTLVNVAELRLGKMLDKSKNKGEITPYLRNINVRWFSFDLNDLAKLKITNKEKEILNIKNGDLFVCEGGEPGRCAVWEDGKTDLTFQKAIHRVRVDENVHPKWLSFNLKKDADSQKLEDYFTGTTIKHLTGQSLKTYTFNLPSKKEQKEIVKRVEALFKKADEIEERYKKAKAYVDKLTQSILAKAFRGELVPQDPNDEPAEKLLERIREERGKLKEKSKREKVVR